MRLDAGDATNAAVADAEADAVADDEPKISCGSCLVAVTRRSAGENVCRVIAMVIVFFETTLIVV